MPQNKINNYTGLFNEPRGPRPNKYKKRIVDERGKKGRENRVINGFWRRNNMDTIMTLTPEELDITIDKFYEEYVADQLKHNPRWDYPSMPKYKP